ncbi:MAG TPA: carboxymuconolactone decarboxylase family protein [Burkholderiales bacterium]|nr:carboxymuconolactone decarboxylase family protein [Burkholderiales bacterium]
MAVDLEQELKRTTALRGFRFGLHDFVAQLKGADALKKHNDATEANYLKKGLLDRKTKELVIIATCVALKDSAAHLQCHMHAAKNAGVTPDEILEVIELIGGWMGNVAKINGLEAWRATFRPDIPSIDRVVELR